MTRRYILQFEMNDLGTSGGLQFFWQIYLLGSGDGGWECKYFDIECLKVDKMLPYPSRFYVKQLYKFN